ncbi:phage shock protein C (PspC) family protein [Ulvibacter sp. MAR_2010_11]|uniref:PspC domain-containing protein n=1 Tax=Ulvibacter sp. MAR_2010_11 TaxID=1250229 RepID=UPI000C2CB727|nr:PspC domain-containing protein [Ulvibacter sp. MAR_2010_11]PKA83836.1 phage shock protein C (PspC) family protein [Ulvibacter sp. MAR_2010_11]
MNKTVNINLAGTFFHIDEDAFGKLSRYLDAIKKSLSDPQGGDEILRDIEARIAELFSEKLESSSHVITLKEVDAVIKVMGQPEDYMVDEEIFEDTPSTAKTRKSTSHKQLFRDIDNKFISGVSSGLAHYVGIDAIWIRLSWVLLTLLTSGIFIVIYILFWILVPAAESTSDKLKMTGEPINISNIEKKFKEGYDTVADKVKSVDYDKYGERVKSGTTGFFDALGSILLTILKIFVKFIGVILIIISLSTLIGLIVGLFTFGSIDLWGHGEVMDYIALVDTTNAPIWLISLLVLLAVGIPFFVLFILGLKLLIDNLKSIGTPAKIILLAVWFLSIIGLGILGIRQATEQAYNGEFVEETALSIHTGDTLRLAMVANKHYEYNVRRSGGVEIKYDENDEKIIYSNDVRLIIRSTRDSIGKIVVEKTAEGKSLLEAKKRAEAINYNFSANNNSVLLDGYFLTNIDNKYRNQEVQVIMYLPVGTILYAEENTYSFHRNSSHHRDILNNGQEFHYIRILENKTECLDCPVNETEDWEGDSYNEDWEDELESEWNDDGDAHNIIINEDGIKINVADEKDTLKIKIGN